VGGDSILDQVENLLKKSGLDEATRQAVMDAWKNRDWKKVLELIKNCDTPECERLRKMALDELAKDLRKAGVPEDTIRKVLDAAKRGDWATVASELAPHGGQLPESLKSLVSGAGNRSTTVSSPEDGEESVNADEIDIGDGKKASAVGIYPNGKSKGVLSMEKWKIRGAGEEKHEWEFRVEAEKLAKDKEKFTVANGSDNKQEFTVERWQLSKDGTAVQEGSGDKFEVTYPEPGQYEIVATGTTKPFKFKFTVRKTRTFNP
jgi:hypothetical protein